MGIAILQVSIRWKALAEIYTMHSFPLFSNLKFVFLFSIFSLQPPFAEVLSSVLLLNGLSPTPLQGCFDQVPFSPVFDCGFQNGAKECIV